MSMLFRRWSAGMLGLASVVGSPLSSADTQLDETSVRIPYTIVEEYQPCVLDLPFRLPASTTPSTSDAQLFVSEYFILHPKKDVLSAWIDVESTYDPLAVSEAGASGLGQLIPRTARLMGLRTATSEELSCLTSLSADSSYVSLLRATRDAVRSGAVPYEVASFVHEPFDMQKNLDASYEYLVEDGGFGRLPDQTAFMRYHAGPSLKNAGPRTRQYPDKIFKVAHRARLSE